MLALGGLDGEAAPTGMLSDGPDIALRHCDPAAGPMQSEADRNRRALSLLPLHFEANQGQAALPVTFFSRGQGYGLFFTPTAAVLRLRPGHATADSLTDAQSAVLRLRWAGANPAPVVTGADALPGRVNYFKGGEPAGWLTNLTTYAKVRYADVYPGVDLVFYGSEQRRLEFDWIVAPGRDPGVIQLAVEGADRASLTPAGDLILETAAGEVRLHKPVIYQWANGARHEVDGGFCVTAELPPPRLETAGERTWLVSFKVANHDSALPLIIDPVLSYASYLGGSDNDGANAVAVDAAGNAYIAGTTTSTDFPTNNAVDADLGERDAFVVKLNADGSLAYATYFGGIWGEAGLAIAVDDLGRAHVTGVTDSPAEGFPLVNAFQPTTDMGGRPDAFVVKLSPTGDALVFSTFLGGNGEDEGRGIALDASNNVVVVGKTRSTNFPIADPLQPVPGGGVDVFVAKLSADGSALLKSTYLGGGGDDYVNGVAVDASGNICLAGWTTSTNFPTANALQAGFGGGEADAFIARLNPSGSALVYSTYLGGSGGDWADGGVALDAAGNAHVAGRTYSSDFPTTNA